MQAQTVIEKNPTNQDDDHRDCPKHYRRFDRDFFNANYGIDARGKVQSSKVMNERFSSHNPFYVLAFSNEQ